MTNLLEATNVSKTFSTGLIRKSINHALTDVSLAMGKRDPTILAVAGESGSGKTTLARILLDMTRPTSGEVFYNGSSVYGLSNQDYTSYRRDVQAVFQDPFEVYNPFYKVDTVLKTPAKKFGIGETERQRQLAIEEALDLAGLRPDETLGRYPHQLSGGQRQRIMVARAILIKPRLIIADEPVSMVDASLRATIPKTLLDLNHKFGISMIYITHDLTTAFQVSDHIAILYQGKIAEAGNAERVIKDPSHPYTQLLINSIPKPTPHVKWDSSSNKVDSTVHLGNGCSFQPRCIKAMEKCVNNEPPLYQINDDKAAKCFLYDKLPIIDNRNLSKIMLKKTFDREKFVR